MKSIDRFVDDMEETYDDMLQDFPDVPKASDKKDIKETMPESPQKALFEDFMF